MKFTVNLKCDNAAFEGHAAKYEVARILREVAQSLDANRSDVVFCHDINGNNVGLAKFTGKQS